MKTANSTLLIAVLTLLCAFAPNSQAYDGVELYECVISAKDRYNSYGQRLTNVRDILQQDRANYHKFGKRDAQDSGDRYFTSPQRRSRWQNVRVQISPDLARLIVNGGDVPITVFVLTENLFEIQAGFIPPGVG